MSKTLSVALILFAATACSLVYAQAQNQDTIAINITSRIRVDKNFENDFLQEAKEDGKMLTKKWAAVRGVAEVETTVDRDEDATILRCSECGNKKSNGEVITSIDNEFKCACGKPKQKCSSCNKPKPCSSCSSCCK